MVLIIGTITMVADDDYHSFAGTDFKIWIISLITV